jgi:hypothetical protein
MLELSKVSHLRQLSSENSTVLKLSHTDIFWIAAALLPLFAPEAGLPAFPVSMTDQRESASMVCALQKALFP